jgi:ankyrin repeat protein
MNGLGRIIGGGLAVAVSLSALSSCRKPKEAVKSDLGEAGYQITTADWFRASRDNAVPAMKKFLAAGFSVNARNEAGDSALHAAATAGAMNAADFLMDQGLAVDHCGALDRTPLMAAVLGNQTTMVRWLLRQGADPRAKDQEGFLPLMLAVREGKAAAVAELAPYSRENLDSALLLAALIGRSDVIDTLTNYGASVYARMEDGRTPLMIAAENGHADSVKLLLDIGSSRFSTDHQGRMAADLATAAGHAEIAALIAREPLPGELALETPLEVAQTMDAFVDAAAQAPPEEGMPAATKSPSPARPIQGEVLSASVSPAAPPAATPAKENSFPVPPLVMRHYREREMPVQVRTVEGETATLQIRGATRHEVKVRAGETVPGTRLMVVGVKRRMEDSKLNLGQPMEVSVLEIRDTRTGTSREWISGVPADAHDPVALVEDATTGQRYTASPGQRFKSADGAEFIVSDVRPNQIVIEDTASGAVQTIPLRGPRG